MGSSPSKTSKTNKKKLIKKPWYKNKSTRISILVAVAVFAFVAIFVASLEIRMDAPVLLMTAHDYSNIVAFNANTGAFITYQLLDLSYQKHLNLPIFVEENRIQFRTVITRNYEQITVANGHHKNPFIATFDCDNNPGWKLNTYFANDSFFVRHPYGLTWDDNHKWWIFTTQDTSSLFIYDINGNPLSLNGMKQHFPGAVFSLINQTNGIFMDTYIRNSVPFFAESRKEQKWDLKRKSLTYGLRGVAIDIEYGLIFVAAEVLGKVLVFDTTQNFTNTFNITFGDGTAPISVINGGKYFPFTLFVTDRLNNNGVYAIKYSKSDYSIWWQAERAPLLQHATGIAISTDSLFVLSQSQHSILRYSPYSGRYLGLVVHFENINPSKIISHKGIGKIHNPVENGQTLGEQLLYIPAGKTCTVE